MASEGLGRAPKGICGEKAIFLWAASLPPLAWPPSPDHFSAHPQLT